MEYWKYLLETTIMVNIDLYHIGGQLVYNLNTGSLYVKIHTGNLPSGVYILRVTADDDRIVGTRKILIQ